MQRLEIHCSHYQCLKTEHCSIQKTTLWKKNEESECHCISLVQRKGSVRIQVRSFVMDEGATERGKGSLLGTDAAARRHL